MAFRAAPLSSGRIVPRVTIGIVMVTGHNIIGLIAVCYIDITQDIVAFVLAKITYCAKRVKYFV